MKTTKEQINEVIKGLERTAEICEISTVETVKNNLKSAISNLQAVEAETASGDTLLRQLAEWKANELREQNKMLAAAIEQSKQAVGRLNAATDTLQKTATSDGDTRIPTTIDNVLFLFRRISALKAEKAKFSKEMGAKWFNSKLADEYGNAIYAALEEIEKLA